MTITVKLVYADAPDEPITLSPVESVRQVGTRAFAVRVFDCDEIVHEIGRRALVDIQVEVQK